MRTLIVLSALSIVPVLATDPAAREVKSVYLLKMGSGLDQFLASELAKSGVYTVTTDPQQADALFTDSLGDGFEKKFAALYPPPAPPEKSEKKDDSKSGALTDPPPVQRLGNASWGRGKGTIFLVDRKSRNLLWSMNRQPKDSATKEMVGHARKIVDQLRRDLGLTPTK